MHVISSTIPIHCSTQTVILYISRVYTTCIKEDIHCHFSTILWDNKHMSCKNFHTLVNAKCRSNQLYQYTMHHKDLHYAGQGLHYKYKGRKSQPLLVEDIQSSFLFNSFSVWFRTIAAHAYLFNILRPSHVIANAHEMVEQVFTKKNVRMSYITNKIVMLRALFASTTISKESPSIALFLLFGVPGKHLLKKSLSLLVFFRDFSSKSRVKLSNFLETLHYTYN